MSEFKSVLTVFEWESKKRITLYSFFLVKEANVDFITGLEA